jgi:chromosome segregation protein
MQLSKLEIKGFKSFGDKAVINFDEGITGIVGPNGCGKSNIVDAIRWVLGEQKTKTLRSDKLENIIFNGTKNRKPTQLAEVSLTFDNTKNILPTEYANVTITRRYYRSGESDYELNGVPCRLKDITNLFLDTGIASNSYAIIELKMVDDILADKDNSRRGLFEEAAGISKFRKRRKETLRKLEGTDADLDRVEDLLFEIEKNLKSLERQAKQAERYYKLKENYKVSSVNLARLTVKNHADKFNRLTAQISAENDKKTKLTKQVSEKEAILEQQKLVLIEKEKTLSASQKKLNDHVNDIRQYESDKKIKNERLRYLNDKSASLKEQISQDKKSNDRAAFSIQGLAQEKELAGSQLQDIKHKLDLQEEEKQGSEERVKTTRDETDALASIYAAKQEEVYQISKTLEINEIQISALKQQLEKASTDKSDQSASLIEFEDKLKTINTDLESKRAGLDELVKEETDNTERISATENTITVIKDEIAELNRKLDARQNEYNLTKSLVENLEGFPEAIKFLKKQANWSKKAPLLSDLITCDDEYRVPIENYLEPLLNYYVVETEADAYKAINLLSDATKGKAHFFVLDNFKKFTPTKDKLYASAFPASEIMEYDEKYKNLISFILDNVYMVDGDENSIPVDADTIFITKSGKVTKTKFSISGGSVGLFEGKKIGRAKNLEKLDKEIKQLNKQLLKVNDGLVEKQQELDKLKKQTRQENIEALQLEINQLNESFISISTRQEQFTEMIERADTNKDDLLKKIEQLSASSKKLTPKKVTGEAELKKIATNLENVKAELRIQTELLADQTAAYNQENIYFHQQENRVKSLEQEIKFKQTTFETSKERIQQNETDLKTNEAEIKQLLETAELSDDQLIKMYEQKEALEQKVNEAEKRYYECRGDIDETEKQQREIQHLREDIDALLLELHNRLSDTKLELSATKERLSVEFDVDLEQIMAAPEAAKELEGLNEESLEEEVEAYKAKIERIGPINPMAMEAYDEIKQRHTFITTQKDDLLKAKESLITTIGEIDLVAKTTFLDSFTKIKANFIKVFRSLFTEEDDCDLILTDPENPLESSIEIVAKPKGKKPLTINQLSGGEKTLTATSLLFAIYLLKPAPFCIFDEVDAPLDDANIDKFNNIIKKFSVDSQFIIVTHNKRTMASTDIIYGITMVEQGVSRVVPVDLRELAE